MSWLPNRTAFKSDNKTTVMVTFIERLVVWKKKKCLKLQYFTRNNERLSTVSRSPCMSRRVPRVVYNMYVYARTSVVHYGGGGGGGTINNACSGRVALVNI